MKESVDIVTVWTVDRHDQMEQQISLTVTDLQRDVALGYISLDALVYYPPWTGVEYLPVWKISQLQEYTNTPLAKIVDHLRRDIFPTVSYVIVFVVFLFGILEQRGWLSDNWILEASLGWGNTIVLGKWWSAWSFVVVHTSVTHWLGNLILLGYCLVRVEKAFGALVTMWGSSLALISSAMAVILLESDVVVGISGVVFGVWVMQVMVGFYLQDSLPSVLQKHYGWYNFFLLVPILLINTMSVDVSQSAHWGGMFGGLLAGIFLRPEFSKPHPKIARSMMLLLGLHGLAFVWIGYLSEAIPELDREYRDSKSAMQLHIPSKFQQGEFCGLSSWGINQTEQFRVYVDALWKEKDLPLTNTILEEQWKQCGLEVYPAILPDGFTQVENAVEQQQAEYIFAWSVYRERGLYQRIVEKVLVEGEFVRRTGCIMEENQRAYTLCAQWIDSIVLEEPFEIRESKELTLRYPHTTTHQIRYAEVLEHYARWKDAHDVYVAIAEEHNAFYWVAMEQIWRLHSAHPEWFAWQDDIISMDQVLLELSENERSVFLEMLRYIEKQAQCDTLHRYIEFWNEKYPQSRVEVQFASSTCAL